MDPEYTISSWKVKAGKEEGRFKAQVYLKLDETQEPIKKVFSAKREYKAKERAKSWAEEQIQQYKKLKSPEARARTVAEEIHDYMDLLCGRRFYPSLHGTTIGTGFATTSSP